MIISSPSKTLFLDLSARDSRRLLTTKNRYFYILYKLFTRVFEFHMILRDKIF